MEGGGAATCGFANLIGRLLRVSGKVRGVAGGVLQRMMEKSRDSIVTCHVAAT